MSRRPARCTQADVRRALKAVEQAGVAMVVDLLPDGTIRITPAGDKTIEPAKASPKRDIVL